MENDQLKKYIDDWIEGLVESTTPYYDIALFKIWVRTEQFLTTIFIKYCTGNSSECGYIPSLKLKFIDEDHLTIFLRDGDKKYVEYIRKIEKLSGHIFIDNPFDIIFADADNKEVFLQVQSIRNYIAHESGEAKKKYISHCLAGKEENFIEPIIFLTKQKKGTKMTYFTYYIEKIREISDAILNPPN